MVSAIIKDIINKLYITDGVHVYIIVDYRSIVRVVEISVGGWQKCNFSINIRKLSTASVTVSFR